MSSEWRCRLCGHDAMNSVGVFYQCLGCSVVFTDKEKFAKAPVIVNPWERKVRPLAASQPALVQAEADAIKMKEALPSSRRWSRAPLKVVPEYTVIAGTGLVASNKGMEFEETEEPIDRRLRAEVKMQAAICEEHGTYATLKIKLSQREMQLLISNEFVVIGLEHLVENKR